ncbi:hypothetical protein PseBG33_5176 [Pseudomonas synxantha BG33R]|uniref:hypothetical protein n=1 Tax=Pseudomonas synxantha TaxID=47883 RepID=UPI00025FF154|nr:hypothetical protein [Pseudomonas synxantha]EIK73438.1 hypothetical protein PseBG33_5176 [Pseudomonas synxantha BG33R]
MLTRHVIPQNYTTPSQGNLSANIGTSPSLTLTAEGISFARDYYTTDRKMRTTLSALQRLPDMIHGIEITFLSTLTDGKHTIEEKKVSAVYWQLLAENDESVFYTHDADSGFIDMVFDDALETVEGTFSFESTNSDGNLLEINGGDFKIVGRDDLTL